MRSSPAAGRLGQEAEFLLGLLEHSQRAGQGGAGFKKAQLKGALVFSPLKISGR